MELPMMNPFLRPAFALLLTSVLANCTAGYNHEWKKVAAQTVAQPPKDLSGAWEGTWKSVPTGHTGTLRAIVSDPTIVDGKTAEYQFRYRATWKRVLSAVFASKHEARLEGRNYVLSGKKDLGKFGGVFEFTGTATPQEFHAKYRAKMDHGEFEMKRPSAP
jgi:hypothetical protein